MTKQLLECERCGALITIDQYHMIYDYITDRIHECEINHD